MAAPDAGMGAHSVQLRSTYLPVFEGLMVAYGGPREFLLKTYPEENDKVKLKPN